jgi:hypothetical protein
MTKLFRSIKYLFLALVSLTLVVQPILAAPLRLPSWQTSSTRVPMVAIHVSELTQALETTPAKPSTPTGAGTTGYEWWSTEWPYFVMYQALEEALRSDGTPFVEVSDADITAGQLLNSDNTPKYPIMISLASEAIRTDEVSPLRNYVAAGGFLFVGSSAFTRNPDGTTRGDFALASEMGLHLANPSLSNWYLNNQFSRLVNHRIVAHIPTGSVTWYMPLSADQIPSGYYPDYPLHQAQKAWQVTATDAQVLATGTAGPLVAVKNYGGGQFIYDGLMQPLMGHGGFDEGMYNYVIFRRAIEWAFESASLPIIKVSPWRYAYDAAFMMRHDLENFPTLISAIDQSAQFEQTRGVKGDYVFTTGTLRLGSEDHQLTDQQKTDAISRLRTAVAVYGATIGSHNGGLPNPRATGLATSAYEYWHWGPDEALDVTPAGYANGKAYGFTSLQNSFQDIEGWLSGLDNGRAGCSAAGTCSRIWFSPAFNSTREDSYDILSQLGVLATGEQKIGVFPHWTVSTQTQGKRYPVLALPTSEWYIADIAQALDSHTVSSVDPAVDFYYNLGALINLYSHALSSADAVTQEYIARNLSKTRNWSTNATGLYDWWQLRSGVAIAPSYSLVGNTASAQATVSGATDPETAVELALPNWSNGSITNLQVFLNGALADAANYRTTSYGVKVRVGTTVSNVEVRYTLGGPTATPAPTLTPPPTPTATVNGPIPYPSTGILDNFNRANGALGSNWAGVTGGYSLASNQLTVGSGDAILWQAAPFGADQEVYVTFAAINSNASDQDLLLKSQASSAWGNGAIEVLYNAAAHQVEVWTFANAQGWVQRGGALSVTYMNGDQFGARARANGSVEVYRNGALLGTWDVTAWPYYAGGGYIGLWFAGAAGAVVDDFGGGSTVAGATATPPASPTVTATSATPTPTRTLTALAANTATPTATRTPTPLTGSTSTPTNTPTVTPTRTSTRTATALPTATLTSTPLPSTGFPSASVVDTFNRANGAPGTNWGGATVGYSVASNQLDVGAGDALLWKAASFGADQEVYLTLANVDTAGMEQDLLLKSQSSTTWSSGVIEVLYDAANHQVQVWTYASAQGWVQRGTTLAVTFNSGDQFGARARANGSVEIYRNGGLVGTRDTTAWTYATSGGYVGLWFASAANALIDDFGGGTTVSGPTPTATATMPPTGTSTPTSTFTATATPTVGPSATVTATPTWTATATPSSTATNTVTAGPSSTATSTVLAPPSETATSTAPAPTATNTSTVTATSTAGASPTATRTPTRTLTSTVTRTATRTAAITATRTATRTTTRTSTLAAGSTATPTRTPTATPTSGGTSTILVGVNGLQAMQDGNSAGVAEAFQYTASASGTVNRLYIYVDSNSTAAQLIVGLYADVGGNAPGALLAQGTLTSPSNGNWNSVGVTGVAVTSGTQYWIAVLAPSGSGSIWFRDAATGGKAQLSAQSTLSLLPATWTSGPTYNNSPMSAYGALN